MQACEMCPKDELVYYVEMYMNLDVIPRIKCCEIKTCCLDILIMLAPYVFLVGLINPTRWRLSRE